VVEQKLKGLVKERRIDLVVANSENIAAGSGITANLFHKVRAYGVDVVTLGDHVYRKADILPTMQASERIVRLQTSRAGGGTDPYRGDDRGRGAGWRLLSSRPNLHEPAVR